MDLKEHLPDGSGDLKTLMLKISRSGIRIWENFRNERGLTDKINMYGDTQVEMDRFADEVLVDGLSEMDMVSSISSEERDSIIEASPDGQFSVMFDPLDGSSLMGSNWTVGTIVGIHRSKGPLVPGRNLAAALYILYGPETVFTYTVGNGVHEFNLDERGSFTLKNENLRIGNGRSYGAGAPRKKWNRPHTRFIERLEKECYKLRFSGSFVADIHRILHQGGVFSYPSFEGHPDGKLRLLFEANPMGFIVSNAGGYASNGYDDILDIQPQRLDQRVPIYIGGRKEVEMAEEEFRKGSRDQQ
jgi:fructose-1,6-bisphosphatase I